MTISLKNPAFPDRPTIPNFLVGQDQSGHWLALETHGLAGGLFASKEAAIRFALTEAEHRSDAVHLASRPIEFHA